MKVVLAARDVKKLKQLKKEISADTVKCDVLNSKKIALVINTGGGSHKDRISDAREIRRATLRNKIPYCTNMSTAYVCLEGIKSLKTKKITVTSLQDI